MTTINIGDLELKIGADATELVAGLEQSKQHARRFASELQGGFRGVTATAPRAERATSRLALSLASVASSGNLSVSSLRGLATSAAFLVPSLLPIAGIIGTIVGVYHRWKSAIEEVERAAERQAERTRAALAALAESAIPVQIADTERLAQREQQLAEMRALQVRRVEDLRLAESRLRLARMEAARVLEERVLGPKLEAAQRELTSATNDHREAARLLALTQQNLEQRERGVSATRAALAHNTQLAGRRVESFIRTLKDELAILEKFPKEIKLGFIVDIEPLKAVILALDEIKAKFGEIKSKLGGGITDLRPIVEEAFVGMADAIGTAVLRMGRGLKGFLSALAATAGQMARQLGRMVINAGLTAGAFGKLGVALSVFTKNPFAAIAIGAALVALGAALTAAEQRVAAGGGAESPSAGVSAAPVAERQGDLTIVFPKGTVFDPSNPAQLDAFVRMMEAAGQRRVIVRTI